MKHKSGLTFVAFCLGLAGAATASAAPVTFTVEGAITGLHASSSAPAAFADFATTRYAPGTSLRLTLTVETATAAGPGATEYRGAVTARSGSIGGDAMTTSVSPATCLAAEFDCRAQVSTFAPVSILSLSSGFVDVDGLQAAGDGAGLGLDLFAQVFLSLVFDAADFDTADGLDFQLADVNPGASSGILSLYGFAIPGLVQAPLAFSIDRIHAGDAASGTDIPAPGALPLLVAGLGLLSAWRGGRRA